MRIISVLTSIGAVVALACGTSGDQLAGPVAATAKAGQATPLESGFVTGSAGFRNANGVLVTHQLHGVRKPDGTVEGTFHLRAHAGSAGGAKLHGRIVCLVVEGNQAWLGGVIEKAGNSNNVGHAFGWRVVDSGEGANAGPDQIGTRWNPPSPEGYCAEMPDTRLTALEEGNLQVHR